MAWVARPLSVALAQWRPGEIPEANVKRLEHFALRAAESGAQLLVNPEYSLSSVSVKDESWVARAEVLDGPFVEALSRISRQSNRLMIALGVLERNSAGRPFNSLVMVGPSGVVSVNRKIHLYDAFGHKESQWLAAAPAEDPQIASLEGWSIGGQTCYDLRFPEVTRRLVEFGADLIVIPSQWVPGPHKIHHWRSLIHARAIESQSWIVAVDQPEPDGVGHTMVVSPMGEAVIELGPGEEFQIATLDHALVESTRAANPVSQANRFRLDWK
jgi:predicted amidohydrolase